MEEHDAEFGDVQDHLGVGEQSEPEQTDCQPPGGHDIPLPASETWNLPLRLSRNQAAFALLDRLRRQRDRIADGGSAPPVATRTRGMP